MANNRVYTESVVTMNGEQAKAELAEMAKRAKVVADRLMEVHQQKGPDSKEFKKLNKELDSLIKQQKDYAESMKKFEKIVNNLNGSSLNELNKAYRQLQQRMRAAKPNTAEFETYAKTLKQVRERIKEVEGQAKTTQKMFGGFFSKIGWAGLVAGALAAFKRFASDMISQTQLVGDKWKFETAGWKAAYGSFIADLSSGRGWNELVQRMKDAYANGKKVAQMLDEIFERNNSLSLTEADLNLEAEKQRKIMMDATQSYQDRIAAAEEYDRIQQEIAQNRKDVAAEEMEAYKLQLQQRTELTDAELDAFVKDYNANKDLIDQAKTYQTEYKAMQDQVNNLYNLMVSGQGLMYDAYKGQYEEAQAALAAYTADADETVVHWAEIIDKYNLGNDQMVQNYVNARKKMVDADTNYERATQRSNRQASNLRKQLANEGKAAQDKAYQDAVKKSDEHFKQLKNQAKQAYADGQISQEEYNARIAAIDESSLKDRIALGERYKQSVIDLQSQLLDLSVKQKQELEKMADDLNAALLKQIEETNKAIDDEVQATCDELSEDFVKRWSEMLDQATEITKELNPAAALKEEMDEELTALQELFDSNLLTEEEFQRKRLEIIKRYAKKQTELQTEPYTKGVQTAQKYVEQVSAFTDALQSAAAAKMEAQMQAELTAAGDNAEKREEIEAGYEQKKLDLQKRYANINMGIEIAKAIAAGALAIMQGFAELGPIGGAVSAALIAATTAAQVATIIAQRNAIMNSSVDNSSRSSSPMGQRVVSGYSGGGYTERRSNDYQEVGVVHANEWVAPAAMVRANPIVFASLEQARRSGNYHSGVSGFADGGMTSAGSSPAAAVPSMDTELLRRTYELMSELKAALPFPAYLVNSQVNAKQEVNAEIKKIVGK